MVFEWIAPGFDLGLDVSEPLRDLLWCGQQVSLFLEFFNHLKSCSLSFAASGYVFLDIVFSFTHRLISISWWFGGDDNHILKLRRELLDYEAFFEFLSIRRPRNFFNLSEIFINLNFFVQALESVIEIRMMPIFSTLNNSPSISYIGSHGRRNHIWRRVRVVFNKVAGVHTFLFIRLDFTWFTTMTLRFQSQLDSFRQVIKLKPNWRLPLLRWTNLNAIDFLLQFDPSVGRSPWTQIEFGRHNGADPASEFLDHIRLWKL